MMNNPKISIIVPVYNTAKYLARCLDSIVNQSMREIEVLVFDDCSTDNSVEIIQQYLQKNNQLIFIQNEKNIGLGNIRNKGVELAKGKYIMFVDSDDWINHKTCEIFFETAEKNSLQILIGDYVKVFKRMPDLKKHGSGSVSDIMNGQKFMVLNDFFTAAWDKFWLRDFIIQHNLKNEVGKYFEDVPMVTEGLIKAKRVAKIVFCHYYYNQANESSITKKRITDKHLIDRHWVMTYLYEKINSYSNSNLANPLKLLLAKQIHPALANIHKYDGNDKQLVANLLTMIRLSLSISSVAILKIKDILLIKRVLIFISPIIYLRMYRMYDSLKSN